MRSLQPAGPDTDGDAVLRVPFDQLRSPARSEPSCSCYPAHSDRAGPDLNASDIHWRSGALTFVPLPGQFLDRAREGRLEVDQLRPRRGHDDADHAVVERADVGVPLDPLIGRHLVGAAAAIRAHEEVRFERTTLEVAELNAVQTARRHGQTWAQIGTALGLTKKAAKQRWSQADEGID